MKDPFSGNLDRIQVVKGWLDDDGKTRQIVSSMIGLAQGMGLSVVAEGIETPGIDGKSPRQQLDAIREQVLELEDRQQHVDALLEQFSDEAEAGKAA